MNKNIPFAAGGVGGSGTRVIAEIFLEMDCYLGSFLTKAYDNLWFSILFKWPGWYTNCSQKDFKIRLELFEKIMTEKNNLTISEKAQLGFNIAKKFIDLPLTKIFSNNLTGAFKKMNKVYLKNRRTKKYKSWAWKEPNTHIFLKELDSYLEDWKYIHLIRNGLDMSFSSNLNQLFTWGSVYGVKIPEREKELPAAALEYWIKANKKAIKTGRELLGEDKFLLVNFDELCHDPDIQIRRILNFLGVDIKDVDFDRLKKIPKIPDSMERYKYNNCEIFSEEQLEEVNNLGFKINCV